ncbi:hypothetical protein C0992_004666, partial [Termitomyces sp. T32_za158]
MGWNYNVILTHSLVSRNAMYGVLFAYTPEVFPAPHRGTGDALTSSFNRMMGILSPVIKITTTTASGAAAAGSSPNRSVLVQDLFVTNNHIVRFRLLLSSIFVAATLFMVAAVLMVFLPIE